MRSSSIPASLKIPEKFEQQHAKDSTRCTHRGACGSLSVHCLEKRLFYFEPTCEPEGLTVKAQIVVSMRIWVV